MNPFDKINEMKDVLFQEAQTVKATDTLTYREHYQKMLNMLTIIAESLKSAEYNYVIENLDEEESYHTFEEYTIKSQHLTDDLILIQPVALDTDALNSIDMSSLCDVLAQLKNADRIKEDIVVMPPYVNVLKAKLALPGKEETEE